MVAQQAREAPDDAHMHKPAAAHHGVHVIKSRAPGPRSGCLQEEAFEVPRMCMRARVAETPRPRLRMP